MIKIEPFQNARRIHLYLGSGMSPRNQKEAQILLSRTLMDEVVSNLDSHITYSYINNFRKEVISHSPLLISYNEELSELRLKVKIESKSQFTLYYGNKKYSGRFEFPLCLPFGIISINKQDPFFDYYIGEKIIVDITTKEKMVEYLSENLSVEMAGSLRSDMMFVVLKGENPFVADRQLSELLSVYINRGYADKYNVLTQSHQWIGDRMRALSNDLSDIEDDMSLYKLTNRTLNTNIETDIFLKNAMSVDDEIFENDVNIQHLENLLSFFCDTLNLWQVIPNNIRNSYISNQITKYNNILIDHKNRDKSLDSNNPVVLGSRNSVISMRNSIENSIINYYESMIVKHNELITRKKTSENKIGGISTNVKNDMEMKRYRRVKRAVYRYLTKKYETLQIDMERITYDARVIEPPTGSQHYLWPRKKRILAAGLGIGLLLPFIPIILKLIFSTKVRSRQEVRNVISAPIIGEIVSKSSDQSDKEVIVSEGTNDPVSESFRIVRSNLSFLNEGNFKILSTSSTFPGEGKSYFAVNMAITLALAGARVCMVDLDLRRRKLSFDIEMSKLTGVTDYLISESNLPDSIIYRTKYAKTLFAIPAGIVPPNPAELLASDKFDRLMAILKERFDYIITDHPPADIVADGAIANRYTDITCYVLRIGYLDRSDLPFIEELYKTRQYKNLSIVLTDVPNSKRYEYK